MLYKSVLVQLLLMHFSCVISINQFAKDETLIDKTSKRYI